MINRLSLSIFLLLGVFLISASAQADGRAAATWRVQKYDLAAVLPQNDADRTVSVRARLDLKNVSPSSASTLTLRISQAAEILGVRIGDAGSVEFTKGEEKAGAVVLQKIGMRVPAVPAGGTLSVNVDYKLTVKENSGLASISPRSALFLPMSFWYPTPNSWFFARGADYAPVNLAVTARDVAVVASGSSSAAGTFDQKLRVQPFFSAGVWDSASASNVAVFFPKGSDAAVQKRAGEIAVLASEAGAFLTGVLGAAPDEPIRIIASERGGGFASGGTVLIDSGAFRRSKIDSQAAMAIAEGLAKMRVGGAVALTGDGDGAVREGLARYLATQFIESKFGKDVADVERARQRSAYSAVVTRDAPIVMVSPIDDYYYAVAANKGAMIWRLLARKVGDSAFGAGLRSSFDDGTTSLAEIRSAFPAQKEFLDYGFDQLTDTNLQAGLPQQNGAEWKAALRNTGSVDAAVDAAAALSNGQRMTAATTVRAKSFGEIIFKSPAKVVRLEIDSEKLYPQTDYSDDTAPREFSESDLLLAVKRLFDRREFANAERAAVTVLRDLPRFDEVRALLGRSLLAQGKNAEAEREFKAILDEKLPSARSIAWANVGLADAALQSGQTAAAIRFADTAILADAEYGASLAARGIRNKLNSALRTDAEISSFFSQFDRAAAANKKADLQALTMPGEVGKFASGIAGQTEQWKTQVVAVDNLDAATALVETQLNIKLLNREPASGTAVYRLTRTAGGWKLSSVDIFEVR